MQHVGFFRVQQPAHARGHAGIERVERVPHRLEVTRPVAVRPVHVRNREVNDAHAAVHLDGFALVLAVRRRPDADLVTPLDERFGQDAHGLVRAAGGVVNVFFVQEGDFHAGSDAGGASISASSAVPASSSSCAAYPAARCSRATESP